jgi:hypothetical protein
VSQTPGILPARLRLTPLSPEETAPAQREAGQSVPLDAAFLTHIAGWQAPAPCKAGEYAPATQQESCLPCPASATVGASVCRPAARRRALLATAASAGAAETSPAAAAAAGPSPAAVRAAAGAAGAVATGTAAAKGTDKPDAAVVVEAAGYAACTLGLLALTGLAARRGGRPPC